MSRRETGNGDPCPQDAEHGRMWELQGTKHQYCPHSGHRGPNIYQQDGTTPVRRPS